jgi:trk system potassium uptake protein TrkH
VVNGFSTIATGGFSASDVSFNKYAGAGEYFGALFMILGSLPYIRYVQLVNGTPRPLWQDSQVAGLSALAGLCGAGRSRPGGCWTTGDPVEPVFREALFNLTSIMSSTGFFSGSFPTWGGFMLVVAFVIGVVGGCSGSSGGGADGVPGAAGAGRPAAGDRRIGNPSSVDPIRYDGRTVEEDVLNALILFVSSYILILGVMSVAMTLLGVDTVSALFAIWTALGNVGYGFGPLVERTGTFIDFPPGAIAIMTLCMILGRLGLLTILVMVLPSFWRR